jgi:hypothetical protein
MVVQAAVLAGVLRMVLGRLGPWCGAGFFEEGPLVVLPEGVVVMII